MPNMFTSYRRRDSAVSQCYDRSHAVNPSAQTAAWRLSGRPGGCGPAVNPAIGQPFAFTPQLLQEATAPIVRTFDLPFGEGPAPIVSVDPTVPGPPIKLAADGFPAAPPFRPGLWDLSAATYRLAQGDTLSGIARLYLGQPQRWTEIYAPNRGRPGVQSADRVLVGTALLMPLEARDRAIALGAEWPGASTLEPGGGAAAPGAGLSTGAKVAIGVAAVGVGGALIYFATRK